VKAAPILSVEQLEVLYQRAILGIRDVTFHLHAGDIVAIVGANGAGKSTTLRAISGFIGLDNARVSHGRVLFKGEAIENMAPHTISKRGILLVPERDKVFPNLTVAENLLVTGSVKISNTERKEREELVYAYFPRLSPLRGREAGLLSGGERQMLGIGAKLAAKPELLLIDELSLGLAPIIVDDLAERLARIRKELAISVVLVEQNANLAMELADYIYILENGRVATHAPAAEIRNKLDIMSFYFGAQDGTRRSYRDARKRRPVHG
jgi:branched-chain amino acid transport system ATP-binding protein